MAKRDKVVQASAEPENVTMDKGDTNKATIDKINPAVTRR